MRRSPSSDERVELLTVPQGSVFKKVRNNRLSLFSERQKSALTYRLSVTINEIMKVLFCVHIFVIKCYKNFASGNLLIFSQQFNVSVKYRTGT
jgi:hypothetical protein